MLVDERTILILKPSAALYDGSGPATKFYIFDTESGRQFSLNETGFFAFSLIDGKKNFGEIVESCQNRYDVSRDILVKDLLAVVGKALDNGLLAVS